MAEQTYSQRLRTFAVDLEREALRGTARGYFHLATTFRDAAQDATATAEMLEAVEAETAGEAR